MKNTKFARSVMAVVLGSALISGSVLAEDTMLNKTSNAVDSAGAKIDSSMKKSIITWGIARPRQK